VTICLALGAGVASAQEPYPWPRRAPSPEALADRLPALPGTTRPPLPPGSFGAWLRGLPLLPRGTRVHLFDGREKDRQDVHVAVVDLDVGARDLQQCADAVMRLRAEWLRQKGRPIAFHPEPGRSDALTFRGGSRAAFERYLVQLFAAAGTASLAAELAPARGEPEPGDVLIQGGHPGHAVLILDVARAADGTRYLLLGQSYMPAQQFHVLRAADGGAWFPARFPLATPEWRTFARADLRRFAP
jgi:hypothetical protein